MEYTVDGVSGYTEEEAARMAETAEAEGREIEILDGDGEEVARCVWCGELVLKFYTVKEVNMGRICRQCANAIRSRGERLVIEE